MKHNMNMTQWHNHLTPILEAMEQGLPIESAESLDSTEWYTCTGKNFKTDRVYRVKQQKRFCNGVELYPCTTTLNTPVVYAADPMNPEGYARIRIQSDTQQAAVSTLVRYGIVYTSKEHASHHGKAMRITTKE